MFNDTREGTRTPAVKLSAVFSHDDPARSLPGKVCHGLHMELRGQSKSDGLACA
jgi:hypothetical protein